MWRELKGMALDAIGAGSIWQVIDQNGQLISEHVCYEDAQDEVEFGPRRNGKLLYTTRRIGIGWL